MMKKTNRISKFILNMIFPSVNDKMDGSYWVEDWSFLDDVDNLEELKLYLMTQDFKGTYKNKMLTLELFTIKRKNIITINRNMQLSGNYHAVKFDKFVNIMIKSIFFMFFFLGATILYIDFNDESLIGIIFVCGLLALTMISMLMALIFSIRSDCCRNLFLKDKIINYKISR